MQRCCLQYNGRCAWGSPAQRHERVFPWLLAPVLVLDQLSPICGMADRINRFECGVGQRHEIRVFGEQLNPEPCMIGGRTEAIRLCMCGVELRATD